MKSKKLGWILLSGASLAAMGAIAPAYAQDDAVSDEIVVTATGRAAAIQDVPIAVQAIDGEALQNAGVTDLRELQQVATSYKFYTGQSNTAGTTAYIRGIGTGADNPGFESAVGYFIDGVYRARPGVALSSLPEVERVEVLRGPQGTLFGRNTTAGAISVVTAGPEFETHAWMNATAGDYGLLSGNIGFTSPVSDTLAFRVDLNGEGRDGFIEDVNTGRDINNRNRWAGRAQVLWDISSNASLRLIYDHAETDEECCVATTFLSQPSPVAGIPGAINLLASFSGLTGLVSPPNPEDRLVALSPDRPFTELVDEDGFSGQLDWELANGMDFTSITGYRDWSALRDQDIDFSGIDRAYRDDYAVDFENFTQEFRLHGENGRIDWLIGAFYGNEKINLTDTIRFGRDANTYVDLLATNADVQLYGTFPMTFNDVVGGTPGALPSAPGLVALVGAYAQETGDATPTAQEALGYAASPLLNPDPVSRATLQAIYNGTADLFASTAGPAGAGQLDQYEVETTTFALFTHNEISLSDAMTLTIGVRYNRDEKEFNANIQNVGFTGASSCDFLNAQVGTAYGQALIGQLGALLPLVCSPAVNGQAVGTYTDDMNNDEFNGVLSLAYDFTPDLMGYASYSRGYKAGGYNMDRLGFNYAITGGPPAGDNDSTPDPTVAPSADDLQFDPEFVDAFELGAKWTGLDGALTLNLALFHQQITDYQNNAFTGFNFQTFNVPDTVTQGVEVEWIARLGENLTWNGGVLYNEAYIDSTVVLPGETLEAGTPLDRAPEWTVTSAVTYQQPIGDNLIALAYLDGRYEGDQRQQVLGRPADGSTDQDAYAIFNARLGIGAEDRRWAVEAWVSNLTDEFYHLGAFAVPEQTSGGVGVYAVYPGAPRTWGLTFRARY